MFLPAQQAKNLHAFIVHMRKQRISHGNNNMTDLYNTLLSVYDATLQKVNLCFIIATNSNNFGIHTLDICYD